MMIESSEKKVSAATCLINSFYGMLLFVFTCLASSAAYAQPIDGKEAFRNGLKAFEAGRYEDAISYFSVSQKEFPLLEDYALFYLSESFHKTGAHDKSLISIKTLIEKYPRSPLVKKARISEIREFSDMDKGDVIQLYEAYLKDYPDDDEMQMLYGTFLKQAGKREKSSAVFKQIYIKACSYSNTALAELNSSDISVSDLMERASNQIKKYEFEGAEKDLRKSLSMDSGIKKEEILKQLAYALFKQKRYREAASLYDKVGDIYFKARSQYRAGDKEGFGSSLNDLMKKNDRRAGYLLLSVASDRRREKDFDAALKIYDDILRNYTSEKEDAQWGIAWTYYLSGDYKKSSGLLSKLYAAYDDPKYLYWQARSSEAAGDDSSHLYNSLIKLENNFYSILSHVRSGKNTLNPVSYKENAFDVPYAGFSFPERIEALISLNMHKEAVAETIFASKKIDSPAELLFVISKFHDLGEYRREIGLAIRMPYSEKFHRFWYPFAFRETVESVSRKYNLDPFIPLSVIREESRFDPDAISPAGARGLMQLMPQTAYKLDRKLNLGIHKASQLNDVKNNIHLGTYYLKTLFSEFNSFPHVLAAYNAGEAIVRKWDQNGNYRSADEFIEDIPYSETRNYVKKVITSYFQYKKFSSEQYGETNLNIILGKL